MTEYRIRIEHDDDPGNPRTDSDCNMGIMACWHGRYNLGDEQPKCDPSEYREDLPEGVITLPLYLYDHSGISISTGAFSCPWDSGQVGFIYVDLERVRKEYGDDSQDSQDKAIKVLQSEVKTYDCYLRGLVYGFTIEKLNKCECCDNVEPEEVDSCWGFYDYDEKGFGAIDAMKDHVEEKHHAMLEKAWNGGML